ncbi:MAG: hypothetical protein RLZZ524_125 [Pseudomonadota bacterium]|jgi:phage terminase Nu1 subunit (DNA packaging protein)
MPRFGNGADLARELGITRQAVSKAEKSGRISRMADGRFDLDAAAIQYRLHTDPEQQIRSMQQARPYAEAQAAQHGVAVLDAPPQMEFTGSAADLLRAKAKREHAEAQLAELELAEKRGEIILAADHKRVIFRLCRSIRDALVPIPDRMAPVVAAEDDPAKVHAELSREIRQVLEALSALANQGDDAERME